MEVIGFVFGSCGFTFAIIGMTYGINASAKVDELEKKLTEAGVIPKSEASQA